MGKILGKSLLLALIHESVDKCYCKDRMLIERGMEQASVARIYYYMQDALNHDERYKMLSRYNLDNEYNKNMGMQKCTPRFKYGTRPDIILHKRHSNSYSDNILILEFKAKLANGKDSIPRRDKEKLEDFTHIERGYSYFLGVFVRLNVVKPAYRYFQNGAEKSENGLGVFIDE